MIYPHKFRLFIVHISKGYNIVPPSPPAAAELTTRAKKLLLTPTEQVESEDFYRSY